MLKLKTFVNFSLIIIVCVFLNINCSNNKSPESESTGNKSPAYMLSAIDGNTDKIYVTRTQSLLNQLSSKYNITETEVGDKMVVLCHKILRDKYGIYQKIQSTMEMINKIRMSSPNKSDFDKLLVVYGVMRNSGQSSDEAVNRLNVALQMDRDALDVFLNQK